MSSKLYFVFIRPLKITMTRSLAALCFFCWSLIAVASVEAPIKVSIFISKESAGLGQLENQVRLILENSSDSPRSVLIKLFNGDIDSRLVSEVAVSVAPRSRVNLEPKPFPGYRFANNVSFRFFSSFGVLTNSLPENKFRLPFPANIDVRVCQSSDGAITTHQKNLFAVDFCVREKTPVLAAKAGVVIAVVDTFTEGGFRSDLLDKANEIVVQHDDGLLTYYGHIYPNSARVKIGDRVQAGQEIALVGNVGYSSGPHLHFEVVQLSPLVLEYGGVNRAIRPNFVALDGEPISIKYLGVYNANGASGTPSVSARNLQPKVKSPNGGCERVKLDLYKRAQNCLRLGDIGAAIALLKKLIEEKGSNPDVYSLMASALVRAGLFSEAIVFFEKPGVVSECDLSVCRSYADSLDKVGRVDEAIEWYRRLLARTPTLSGETLSLARLLAKTSRQDEALQLLRSYDSERVKSGLRPLFSNEIQSLLSR